MAVKDTGKHLSDQLVAQLAAKELEPTPAQQRHMTQCAACRQAVASTRDIVASLAGLQEPVASTAAIERALRAVASSRPSLPDPAHLVKSLRPDQQSAPPGLRAVAAPVRQWLFKAGPFEIDVQAQPEGPEHVRLHGQVLGQAGAEEGLPVHLRHAGRGDMATTGRHGEFTLGPARLGNIVVLVETDRKAYELPLDWQDAEKDS